MTTPKAKFAGLALIAALCGGFTLGLTAPAWAGMSEGKAAKITGVRVHDLRHSYASILASAGYSLPMIGALLGHTQPGTTARYAHLFDEPLREAAERVGEIVTMSGGKGGEVAPLRGGRTGGSG